MILKEYNKKRNFDQTPEPPGDRATGTGLLRFVVQMHHASHLHYDFRLEVAGVLKSWAVPKGPSVNPQDSRLAVEVEEHPIPYASFEGVIPAGNYGAGTVMVWDEGTYIERNSKGREDTEKAILAGLDKGHITFLLEGRKLRGEFALVQTKKSEQNKAGKRLWLLIKKRDQYASFSDITRENLSVKTGRTTEEITSQAPAKGEIWLPGQNASTEKLPSRYVPMLPVETRDPVFNAGWIYEMDRGGYRTLAEVDKGTVHLYSKQRLSFDKKFPEICGALQEAPISAILDGEVVESKKGKSGKIERIFWVRDILHLNGLNLRPLPLRERKRRLQETQIFNDNVRFSVHFEDGQELYEKAGEENIPAILARETDSPYQSGISKRWLRIKTQNGTKDPKQSARLSNLDKLYWPKENLTKGDLVRYYEGVASALLPHLKDRPQSLHRFPDGIEGEGFFQKDLTGYHPRFVSTERIFSGSSGKSIDYLLCQNESTLLYMANLGCIELNPWLSRVGSLDKPDFVVIDLDPDENDFSEVIEVALSVHEVLDEIGAANFCKTSGASGIHIFIPTQAKYSYEFGRKFAEAVCRIVQERFPENTSMIRTPAKRKGKIYLDCLQNAQGQTVASVYSVRPIEKAPVSTPLQWKELKPGLRPELFTIHNVPERLKKSGDFFLPVLQVSVDLDASLVKLKKKFPHSFES